MTIGTKYPNLFAALAAPFGRDEIKTRSGGGGRQLSYITARTAMTRLDEVVGPERWRNRHRLEHLSDGLEAVICTIEIKIDGEWIAKEDAGGFKEMSEKNRQGETVEDEENTVKTAYSDAFKRTAVLWGIGRHLYGDGSAQFAVGREPGSDDDTPPVAPAPRRQEAPPAPRQAPDDRRDFPSSESTRNGNGQQNGERKQYDDDRPPTSGRALFAWSKKQEEQHGKGLVDHLQAFMKKQNIVGRIVDLDAEQTAVVHSEAVRAIAGQGN